MPSPFSVSVHPGPVSVFSRPPISSMPTLDGGWGSRRARSSIAPIPGAWESNTSRTSGCSPADRTSDSVTPGHHSRYAGTSRMIAMQRSAVAPTATSCAPPIFMAGTLPLRVESTILRTLVVAARAAAWEHPPP